MGGMATRPTSSWRTTRRICLTVDAAETGGCTSEMWKLDVVIRGFVSAVEAAASIVKSSA